MRAEVLLVRAAAALARIDVASIEDDEMNCLIQLSDVIANRIAEISRARNPEPDDENDNENEDQEQGQKEAGDADNDVDGFLASLEAQAESTDPAWQPAPDVSKEDSVLPPSKRQRAESHGSPAQA